MSFHDPKSEAARVRATFWPSGALPVDPVAIARSMGIDVMQAELPENVSGALVKKVGADPLILLARDDHATRKRFTCAHEIGHYIRRAGKDEYQSVDFRSQLASKGTDPEEVFANQFAANLLMPEDDVRGDVRVRDSLVILAHKFGVSPEAMKFRLENLGLSSDRDRQTKRG